MKRGPAKILPEWSYRVQAEEISRSPTRLSIVANENERSAVARRLGLLSLDALKADIELARDRKEHVVHVTGKLYAELVQECVVSLEPVKTKIEEEFEGWFADNENTVSFVKARQDRLREKTGIDIPMLDEQEDPDPIIDGMIDIGELTVQHLSLAVPRYPHKEGADCVPGDKTLEVEEDKSEIRKNPFAALRDWKSR